MKIHVVIGVYRGVIDEVRASDRWDKAAEIERELCEKLDVPLDPEEREEYYEKNVEPNEVSSFSVELE